VHERIERADAPTEPAVRSPERAYDDLRQRLDRLGDGHPSSDQYRDAHVSRRDGRADTSRTDTSREDATGNGTDREEATGTRTDDGRDLSPRAGSGWDGQAARDRPDRPAENDIQLPTDQGRHILDGDGEGKPGGGHRHGTGKPGKTEFPQRWPDEVILAVVAETARTPDSVERQRDGSWHATGERDGIRLTAVVLADGRIWTAWPHPGGAGVRQNPTEGAG
jgi:hypothetical protein